MAVSLPPQILSPKRGALVRRSLFPLLLAGVLGVFGFSCNTSSDSDTPVGGTLSYLPVDGVTDAIFVDNTIAIFPGLTGESGSSRSTLYFADVSDPYRPRLLSSLRVEPVGETSAFFAVPHLKRVYLAHFIHGVLAVDYGDPKNPRISGLFNFPGFIPANYSIYCVAGRYPYLYAPYNQQRLQVYDLSSDPDNPSLLGKIEPFGYRAYDGEAAAGTLLFAEDGIHLLAIDISDPANPAFRSAFATDGLASRPNGVSLADDGASAWVADSDHGLIRVDLSDLSNPQVTLRDATMSPLLKVSRNGNLLGLARASRGYSVLRETGALPEPVAGSAGIGYAMNIFLSGNYGYVAMGDGGIKILRVR